MLANPPSTFAYKLRESTIDFPTSMYHGSDNKEKMVTRQRSEGFFFFFPQRKEKFEKNTQIKDVKI